MCPKTGKPTINFSNSLKCWFLRKLFLKGIQPQKKGSNGKHVYTISSSCELFFCGFNIKSLPKILFSNKYYQCKIDMLASCRYTLFNFIKISWYVKYAEEIESFFSLIALRALFFPNYCLVVRSLPVNIPLTCEQ